MALFYASYPATFDFTPITARVQVCGRRRGLAATRLAALSIPLAAPLVPAPQPGSRILAVPGAHAARSRVLPADRRARTRRRVL